MDDIYGLICGAGGYGAYAYSDYIDLCGHAKVFKDVNDFSFFLEIIDKTNVIIFMEIISCLAKNYAINLIIIVYLPLSLIYFFNRDNK